MSWKRAELQNFLDNKRVSYDNHLHKIELLDLRKKHASEKLYVIDQMAKEHGHEVLRLPLTIVNLTQLN